MSPGDTALNHAETQARDVSPDAPLPDTVGGQGENHVNGNGIASTGAGPSSVSQSVGSARSTSPSQTSTPKVPTKRRRLDAELAFSSPGPAFQLEQDAREAKADSSDSSARTRRPRRSITSTNGNSESKHRRSSHAASASAADGSRVAASGSNSSNNKLSNGKKKASNEVAHRTHRESSISSAPPNRSRSRSKSALDSEPDLDAAVPREDSTIAIEPTRPKPQITPLTQLDPQAPLPEILKRRRSERIALAQSELEDVHDNHDMLVRELFHLTKFVTMVGYDPDVARNDQSDVFTTFKHAHDLSFSLDDAGSGAQASTSGRVTRRRVNARLESLSLKRPQPPSTPATPTNKVEGRKFAVDRNRRSSSIVVNKSRINDMDASDREASTDDDEASEEVSEGSDLDTDSRSAKGKGKASESEGRKKASIKRVRLSSTSQKRQSATLDETSSDVPVKRSGPRKNRALDELDAFILRQQPRPLPEHPPPLHILAPHQVPAPRRFGGNVNALWDSFGLLHDGEASVEDDDLQTYLKLDERWRAGLPIHPEAGSTTRHVAHKDARNKTHRDHLLEAVAASYPQMRQYARLRQQNARKIARMVAQHWERQLGTSEREKKAEERRVRALAKWTLREVLKQWRLAVNVVRARKAAVEKAEKEKLDKEQLNAILEQSTAMLKKQHEVMTRADSLVDSEDESDRTSYGSDGTAEPDDSDAVVEAGEQTADDDEETEEPKEPESASLSQDVSTPAIREHPLVSTPAAEDIGNTPDREPSTLDDEATSVSRGTPDMDAKPEATTSRRSRRSARASTSKALKAKDFKLDADDVEFDVDADDGEQEDAELERQMGRGRRGRQRRCRARSGCQYTH